MIVLLSRLFLIGFYMYFMIAFFSYALMILNIILITLFWILIGRNLKDKDNHKYYLVSILLTAILFMYSVTGAVSSTLTVIQKLGISLLTGTMILVYVFAICIAFLYELLLYLKNKNSSSF